LYGGTLQTRVTFELYYRAPGEAPFGSAELFYNVDDEQRLLVQETESSIRRNDAKRYDAAAVASSSSSVRP